MKNFLALYFPFLISFINKRLITQTDIFFASLFGGAAIAAAGLPNNIMLIDQIMAMAIVPILSSTIADWYNKRELELKFEHLLAGLFKLSILLSFIGFCVYPLVLKLVVSDLEVLKLSNKALFWLNLSIIPEFFRYSISVCLNATNKGKYVLIYSSIEVILNLLLNWFFVKYLGFGFVGIYIATFIVSSSTCLLTYMKISSDYPSVSFVQLFKFPDLKIQLISFKNTSFEFIRVCVEKFSFLLMICIISLFSKNDNVLVAFTISLGIYFLMLMPQVALMRSLTIYLIQKNNEFKQNILKISFFSFFLTITITITVLFYKQWILSTLYNVKDIELLQLSSNYINILIPLLSLRIISTIQRGIVYANELIKFLAIIDIISFLIFILPLFSAGQYVENSYITWIGFYIAEMFSIISLYLMLSGEFKRNTVDKNEVLAPNSIEAI